jgi:hypothetical protein
MTAFAVSDIPSNINTLEKLGAWVGLALTRCNPNKKVLESPGETPIRVCEAVTIKDDANDYRLVIRLVLPLAPGYAEATTKFWESAIEIDTAALPTAFKSN